MILGILADSRTIEKQLISYLEERSVVHVHLTNGNMSALMDRFDTGRHWVLTGLENRLVVQLLSVRSDFRLAIVTEVTPLRDAISAFESYASAVFNVHDPDFFERIERFVIESMCSFERPTWDQYFMKIASVVALRSNCMKRQVAAVLVRDNRIVATGYNGTPRGVKNCNEGGCPRCNTLAPSGERLDECLCNHAEENAITQAAFHGISIRDATMYCTFSPCLNCAKLIVNAGVAQVVFSAQYTPNERALSLLANCGVRARRLEG